MKYFNHLDYNLWYRSYQLNLRRYLNQLDAIRLELDDLPGKEAIEQDLLNIEKQLEQVIPRNFDRNADPLSPSEVFAENFKIMLNFFFRLFGKSDPFLSVYQKEKNRVLSIHKAYNFKAKYLEVRNKLSELEIELGEMPREEVITTTTTV